MKCKMDKFQYFLFLSFSMSILMLLFVGCGEKEKHGNYKHHDPHITKIFKGITVDSIEANFSALRSYHQDINAARHWIYDTFRQYEQASDQHLQVSYTYSSEERDSSDIVNIAAVLPGAQLESKERMYLVSGYYGTPQSDNEHSTTHQISNTAVIMELVRTMSEHEFDATIVFLISMDHKKGEGAAHFVRETQKYNLHIAGIILNDIASQGQRDKEYRNEVRISVPRSSTEQNKPTSVSYDNPSREFGKYFYKIAEQFVPYLSVKLLEGEDTDREEEILYSDSTEYPIVRVNSPGPDDYIGDKVSSEDAVSYIDYNNLLQITKLNAAVLSTLANAPAGPKNVRAEVSQVEDNISVQWEPNDEPDLKGYEIVWRAADESNWTGSEFVDDTTAFTLEKITPDNYSIGVRAVDRYDHKSPAAFPASIQN